MKRFYKLLSLFLLSIVGITNAVAQLYKKGTRLETTEDVVGQQVLLYAPQPFCGFMNGTENLSNVTELCPFVNESWIYEFEAVGRQVDGYELYRLKQVSSGKYVKDADGQVEKAFELTAKASEAFEMTVLRYVDITDTGKACGRNTSSSEKQDLSNPGFVLCRGELAAKSFNGNNEGYVYIGSMNYPLISPSSNSNMWEIWSVTADDTKGLDKLATYLENYFPGEDLLYDFPAGTNPGFYQAEDIAEAQVLVNEIREKFIDAYEGKITLSDAEVDELCDQLKAAYEKLQEKKIKPNGYYFIYNDAGRYLYAANQGETTFLYSKAANSYEIPENISYKDLKYIWKVTPVEEGDNAYLVKNMLKGLVISGQEASCSGTDNGMGFTLASSGSVKITDYCENSVPSFIFYTTAYTKNSRKQYHAKFDDNPVMAWEYALYSNPMHFVAVTEEEFNAVIEQAMQLQRNEKLAALYSKVTSNVMEGTSYVWNGEKDADFTHEGALVSPTGDEATSHVFSRAKQSDEGTYEALLDGDFSTYFHSAWSGGAFTPSMSNFHDVCFELDEAVSGIVTAKIAKRLTGKDYPTKFAVFGTNEVDKANPDAADWTLEDVANISWDTPLQIDDEESERQKYVGYASFNLSQEYKYVRLAAIATIYNETNPMTNRGYFAISEMNLWKGGEFDAVNSTISMVSQPTMDALNAALAKAKDEIAAGTASEATIAELEAAYAQFVQAAIKQEKQIDCTVGAAGVGTLILPFDAELPQDMQAYRCTGVDGTRIQTEAVNEIPANVPLLITALPGTYQFTGVPEGTEKNYTDGVLTGVMEKTVITSGYVMQQQQNVVAFYPVSAEKPIAVPAYKCYLNYAGEQQAMRFDNVLTDLKGVTTSEGNSSLYDLQGRRTQTATAPGVYIQNNRKIVKFKK